MAKDPQYRNVCFTLNNYTQEEYTNIIGMTCRYMVVGIEVGKNGTPHLQGYIEFTGGIRFSTLKRAMPRAHIERRYGNALQASEYCKKDGNFTEVGTLSQQGKRSDLDDVVEMVEAGASTAEIAEVFPKSYVMYGTGIERLRAARYTDRAEAPCVTWLWGTTGTGKTRTATESHASYYIKDGTMWWNGYEQQEAIIIDDFDGAWPFRDLLRLLDRYPYQGQFKGGYIKINSPFIYITCEHEPSHYWKGNELAQVERRLTTVTCLGPRRDATEVAGNTSTATLRACLSTRPLPLPPI